MSHSTPEQPTFGEHDESDALLSDAIAAAELDDLRDRRVYAARLGCVLHMLHIAVTAGMTSTFFMGPLGKGPWNEWERDHLFSRLGLALARFLRSFFFSLFLLLYGFIALLTCCPEQPLRRSAPSRLYSTLCV